MSRCVVCGALPAEQCNQDTHDAHYRMWQQSAEVDGSSRTRWEDWPLSYWLFSVALAVALVFVLPAVIGWTP